LHLVGDLFEFYDDARTYRPQKCVLLLVVVLFFTVCTCLNEVCF